MSRLRSVASLGVAFAVYASGGASAVAQQPTEAELIQRIEALRVEYEAASATIQARHRREVEEAERVQTPLSVDTVQVGPMTIVSLPTDSEVARDLFTAVWQASFPTVTESPSLRATWFTFRGRARPRGRESLSGPNRLSVGVDVSPVWVPTRALASARVADAIARVAIQDFPEGSVMRVWLAAASYPTDESAYRALATGTSGAIRACLSGETAACMASLGFGLRAAADRLPVWFSDQERQGMVDDAWLRNRLGRDDSLYRRCVEENDARACDPILAELDWVASAPAGTSLLRTHLLWFAAREGGPGAWQRAHERREAPMPEVLADMSGRSIERLVADWRTYVIAQRPDAQAGLGGRGTRGLLWSLIFAAMALRSTRWRLA